MLTQCASQCLVAADWRYFDRWQWWYYGRRLVVYLRTSWCCFCDFTEQTHRLNTWFIFNCRNVFLFNRMLFVLFSQCWGGEWPLIMLQSFRPPGVPGFRSGPTSQPSRPWSAPGVLPVPLWQWLWSVTKVFIPKLFHCWRTVSRNDDWETLLLSSLCVCCVVIMSRLVHLLSFVSFQTWRGLDCDSICSGKNSLQVSLL